MKNRVKHIVVPALILTLLSATAVALAQQAPKPETLIKVRQSTFQVVAWNSGRIKASVEGQYNKDDVIKAANTIAAIANSGIGALFVPGTETGKGWHDTAAKADVFSNSAHFAELGSNFAKEATELASIAGGGDPALVKAQYGKLTRTCKACHDDFKNKE